MFSRKVHLYENFMRKIHLNEYLFENAPFKRGNVLWWGIKRGKRGAPFKQGNMASMSSMRPKAAGNFARTTESNTKEAAGRGEIAFGATVTLIMRLEATWCDYS